MPIWGGCHFTIYGRLKERVLSAARIQINKHTDIFIDIKENKTGRKVTSLTIFVKPNPKKQEHVPASYKQKKLFTAPGDENLYKPGEYLRQLETELQKKKRIKKEFDDLLAGEDPAVMGATKAEKYKYLDREINFLIEQIAELQAEK